jgi:tRNA(Arg) A34 adenosine deaminase TadA
MSDIDFLKRALNKAEESITAGGFPAGAVMVRDDEVVGEGISIGCCTLLNLLNFLS